MIRGRVSAERRISMKNKMTKHIWSMGLAVALVVSGFGTGTGQRTAQAQTSLQSIALKTVSENPASSIADVSSSANPVKTHTPKQTAKQVKTPVPSKTEKPAGRVKKLKKVSGVKLIRYSTHAVKVTWKKQKKAKYYRVYYAKKKKGKYKYAGMTKDTHLLVKKLKKNATYFFCVQACKQKILSASDSAPSVKKRMKMIKYHRKIIFAGDSICEGIGYGQAFPQMHSDARKKTVAYRGLNTITFHTKKVFQGRTGLQKLVAEKPYRAYIMLGVNEIHYRRASLMIDEYKKLINNIKKESPDTDIVLCAVAPVTRAECAKHTGMRQIPIFNKKLKKLAKSVHANYLDYTAFLKDSGGYLKTQYAAGDGYHWKASAYVQFGKVVGKYDRSLDR